MNTLSEMRRLYTPYKIKFFMAPGLYLKVTQILTCKPKIDKFKDLIKCTPEMCKMSKLFMFISITFVNIARLHEMQIQHLYNTYFFASFMLLQTAYA